MTIDRDHLHLADNLDAGEATKRLTPRLRDAYPDVPWRDIAGLRDVVMHRYEWVDHNEVWRVIEDDLAPLLENVRRILRDLSRSGTSGTRS